MDLVVFVVLCCCVCIGVLCGLVLGVVMIRRQPRSKLDRVSAGSDVYKEKIRYEDLVTQPEPTMKGIYEFLEMDYYPHRFHSLNQFSLNGLGYDDSDLGQNLHTIKTELRLEENPYKKMIPQSIIDKYGHIKL